MKLNTTNLKDNTIFTPSPSMESIMSIKNGEALRLWLHMRSEYAAFVSQEQKQSKQYDNTLTCYNKTEESLAKDINVSPKTIQRALKELVKLGLVVQLPFEAKNSDGATMKRNNHVVLDYNMVDYKAFLSQCITKLNAYRERALRNNRGVEQLNIIKEILGDATEVVAPAPAPAVVEPVVKDIEPIVEMVEMVEMVEAVEVAEAVQHYNGYTLDQLKVMSFGDLCRAIEGDEYQQLRLDIMLKKV